jgi:hypothetical protein
MPNNGRLRCRTLLLAAEHDCPTIFARIGVMRALNRHVELARSTSTGKTSIGDAGSWRGIDDNDRKVLRRRRSSRYVLKPRPIISAIS